MNPERLLDTFGAHQLTVILNHAGYIGFEITASEFQRMLPSGNALYECNFRDDDGDENLGVRIFVGYDSAKQKFFADF